MRDWERAWRRALYGRGGAFRGTRRPHFRTAPQVGDEFAAAVLRLADRVDAALGRPGQLDLIDLGAGGGELTAALHRMRPDRRYRVTGVDVADRPDGLDAGVRWQRRVPRAITGLVIANEWLDAVPCPVVARVDGAVRRLLVDRAGTERPGRVAGTAERAWLERWWPLRRDGERAEVGIPRDRAWADLHGRMRAGLAVAVDYHHDRANRPASGTLTGYRAGRQVPPRPDGSCDITAHVALDACARTPGAVLLTQSEVFAEPAPVGAGSFDALVRRGQLAELTDPHGMGGFGWLIEGFGVDPEVAR